MTTKKSPATEITDAKKLDRKSTVGSLAKGFKVLEAFSVGYEQMTISDVSKVTGLDAGTVFRNLNTLVDLGYLKKDADAKLFRLTFKVLDLGFHAIGRSDVRDLVLPILRGLVAHVGEAASFGVLEGADILYLERVRGGVARLGVDIRVGTRVPAYTSTIGQALLAFLPARDQDIVLHQLKTQSDVGVVDIPEAEILSSLKQIKKDGYALRASYFNSSLHVLAVPVLDRDGYPLASISVVAPSVRVSQDDMLAMALEPARTAAAEISKAVRASGSVSSVLTKT
ncbi:IclR family transcriptional regulator [Pelobacter seleniigenes]|uniref:IclR family transcriptional regulator n=1 Tax=Pelobacter seleniigenes TaxID=407188 RepID=UPI0004A777FA|nr:IclR family transcriptional regulator [Pelobacter seleniigenes]